MEKNVDKHSFYLSFSLDDKKYAMDIGALTAILDDSTISNTNQTGNGFAEGCVNFEGLCLPLVDMRKKLGAIEYHGERSVLITELEHGGEMLHVGLVVDGIENVMEIKDSQVHPPLGCFHESDFSYIGGEVKEKDQVISIVDTLSLFSIDEINELILAQLSLS